MFFFVSPEDVVSFPGTTVKGRVRIEVLKLRPHIQDLNFPPPPPPPPPPPHLVLVPHLGTSIHSFQNVQARALHIHAFFTRLRNPLHASAICHQHVHADRRSIADLFVNKWNEDSKEGIRCAREKNSTFMIIAHEYQTLQSWHDLHGPLVQLLVPLPCSIILLLSSFCNLFCFVLLSNTFAHLNRLMTSFERCFSYTSFFLLLSVLKISFEHRLFNTSFFLLLFGLKIRFELWTSPVLHQFPSIAFWTED